MLSSVSGHGTRNRRRGPFAAPARDALSRPSKSGKLRASPPWSPAVNPIYKWMGIVLAVGIALMVIEYRFAKRKKEGFTPTDRQRVTGIFWITIFLSLLVGVLMWMSD